MRSRYAASARGLVPYLVKTLHPSRRAPDEARRVRRSLQHTRWLGLCVLAVEGGSILEATGVVAPSSGVMRRAVRPCGWGGLTSAELQEAVP